jgi:hypothetical protein
MRKARAVRPAQRWTADIPLRIISMEAKEERKVRAPGTRFDLNG